jgi:hypothetical protein
MRQMPPDGNESRKNYLVCVALHIQDALGVGWDTINLSFILPPTKHSECCKIPFDPLKYQQFPCCDRSDSPASEVAPDLV